METVFLFFVAQFTNGWNCSLSWGVKIFKVSWLPFLRPWVRPPPFCVQPLFWTEKLILQLWQVDLIFFQEWVENWVGKISKLKQVRFPQWYIYIYDLWITPQLIFLSLRQSGEDSSRDIYLGKSFEIWIILIVFSSMNWRKLWEDGEFYYTFRGEISPVGIFTYMYIYIHKNAHILYMCHVYSILDYITRNPLSLKKTPWMYVCFFF